MTTNSISISVKDIEVTGTTGTGQVVFHGNSIPRTLMDTSNNNTLIDLKGDLDVLGTINANKILNNQGVDNK